MDTRFLHHQIIGSPKQDKKSVHFVLGVDLQDRLDSEAGGWRTKERSPVQRPGGRA